MNKLIEDISLKVARDINGEFRQMKFGSLSWDSNLEMIQVTSRSKRVQMTLVASGRLRVKAVLYTDGLSKQVLSEKVWSVKHWPGVKVKKRAR